jgi:hypothetical protein
VSIQLKRESVNISYIDLLIPLATATHPGDVQRVGEQPNTETLRVFRAGTRTPTGSRTQEPAAQ